MKFSVMVCLFPDNRGSTFLSPDIWVGRLLAKLETDPDCHQVDLWYRELGDTPITMLRNRALRDAEKRGVDYVLFLDSDNKPDLYLGIDPEAKPFWDTSLAFLRAHNGPAVVAAPYCGSPPDEGVHAFRWVSMESNNANPDFALKTITRHEAAFLRGIRPAAAAATGVMLIDMRGVKRLDHPRFDYEWKDATACDKASTEDVYFTRNLSYVGVPTYINWDAWAGHLKIKMVGKPVPIHQPSVTRQLRREARRMAGGPDPARDRRIVELGQKIQAAQESFEKMAKELLALRQEGAVPSQEPPVRVAKNSQNVLPPTQDPVQVTPCGMTLWHAGDPAAAEAWQAGRREDLAADAAEREADAAKTAAERVREQHEREVQDQRFVDAKVSKREAELLANLYPELAGANGPTTPGQP